MIGCLRTCVHKQSINALYFEFENDLKFYNLKMDIPLGSVGGSHLMKRAVLLTASTAGGCMPSGTAGLVTNITGSLCRHPPVVHEST